MRTIVDIVELIKDIISIECGDRKVFDSDVAKAIGVKQGFIATCKKRSVVPFEQLIEFASIKKIDLNYLLIGNIQVK